MGLKGYLLGNLLMLSIKHHELSSILEDLINKTLNSKLEDLVEVMCEIYEKTKNQFIVEKTIPSQVYTLRSEELGDMDLINRMKAKWITGITDVLKKHRYFMSSYFSEIVDLVTDICKLNKDNLVSVMRDVLIKYNKLKEKAGGFENEVISEIDVLSLFDELY